MQAWHYGLASPPTTEYNHADLDSSSSQSSDTDSDCSSSATLASTASSLSTLASAASTSVWSAPSSQNSDYSSYSVTGSESNYCGESRDAPQHKGFVTRQLFGESLRPETAFPPQTQYQQSQALGAVPPELRKNPRRTSAARSASRGGPPTLSRQVDRKVEFVDKLVDSATYIVEAIWPTSSLPCRADFGTSNGVLPLRKFIEETLRRSRTSYSTLQVGLYYLVLIKPHIPAHDFTMEQTDQSHASRVLQCGRRMFLAALILASKWLQDRNYSARAWSKISGLQISEINDNERAFLAAVNWKLHVHEDLYKTWSDLVMDHTPSMPPPPGAAATGFERDCAAFKKLIRGLTPELDNVDDLVVVQKTLRLPCLSTSSPPAHRSFLSQKPGFVRTPFTESPTAMWTSPSQQLPTHPGMALLPTPLPTPGPLDSQSSCRFSTPAVSAASQLLGRGQSMSSAFCHANAISSSQTLDRWPAQVPAFTTCKTSPQRYVPTRRSSLATTVSTASSPESMVSDSSSQSRTSSVSSSASLSHHAPAYMQARRAAGDRQRMVYGQRYQLGQTSYDDATPGRRKMAVSDLVDMPVHPALEDADAHVPSPESYGTYLSSHYAADPSYQLSVRDAAFALQELHNHREEPTPKAAQAQSWSVPTGQAPKRKRADSSALQENVRGLLAVHPEQRTTMWSDEIVGEPVAHPVLPSPTKRARLSATGMYQPHLRPEMYAQHRLVTAM